MPCCWSAKAGSAEAEPLLRNALDVALKVWGADNYHVGYARVSLAMVLHDEGRLARGRKRIPPGARDLRQIAAARIIPIAPPLLMHLARLAGGSRQGRKKRLPMSEAIDRDLERRPSPASNPPTAQAHAIHAYALSQLRQAAARRPRNSTTAVPVLLERPRPRRSRPCGARRPGMASSPVPASRSTASTARTRQSRMPGAAAGSSRSSRAQENLVGRILGFFGVGVLQLVQVQQEVGAASRRAPGCRRAPARNPSRDCGSGTG